MSALLSRAHARAPILVAALSAALACKQEAPPPTPGAASALPVTALPPPPPSPPPPTAAPGAQAPASFADLAANADPAVVFVKTIQEKKLLAGRRVVGQGRGSGFVYDSNGLILTNNHVIESATEISVVFGRTREVSATVVGRDPPTDVAVLRVEATGLPALPLGDSDAVRVGDWVVAIGNPFELQHTVSAGILSAKGRTHQDVGGLDETGYYEFLQTDASINPGNSGGPLLDTHGRVVGINTARAEANNIGFAIPINMVKEILPRLLKDGWVRRSKVGVHVASVQPEDAERLQLGSVVGALITHVIPGGPADRAGLRPDDVILEFDDKPVSGAERLRWIASLAGVGRTVTLRIARGGRLFETRVTLEELRQGPLTPPLTPFAPFR